MRDEEHSESRDSDELHFQENNVKLRTVWCGAGRRKQPRRNSVKLS